MHTSLRKFCRHQLWGILFLISLTLSFVLGHWHLPIQVLGPIQILVAQPAHMDQLVKKGVDFYQRGNYKGAIEAWHTALEAYRSTDNKGKAAIVLENLARAHQQLGQLDQAIESWQQVVTLYRQLDNPVKVGQMLTELAQVHNQLGQYRRAITHLCNPRQANNTVVTPIQCEPSSALGIAQVQGNLLGEMAAFGNLGNTYLLQGEYDQAIGLLEDSLERIKQLDNPSYQANFLFSIGNAYASRAQLNNRRKGFRPFNKSAIESLEKKVEEDNTKALDYLEQSFKIAQQQKTPVEMLSALLHAIPIYARNQETSKVETAKETSLDLLEQLPDSQATVFATLDLANLLQSDPDLINRTDGSHCSSNDDDDLQVQSLLQRAIRIAHKIDDHRGESFALGRLGHLYECRQNYTQALKFTQKARWTAADLNSQDILYLWEWQTGRILNRQSQNGDKSVKFEDQAIMFFEQAITSLERIRSDILVANRDSQFDFRDTIEPIYRELAELRLERESFVSAPNWNSRENIKKVLETIDSLKLVELQNYFGDDCVITVLPKQPVERVDYNTAVLNTIILPERTAVILALPDGRYQLHWIELQDQLVIKAVNDYRLGLEKSYISNLPSSEKLYDWLIRPFEQELANSQIKTLVFVQDGIFRSVPMSALHDGQQYLIQQYAVATTPSLQLTTPKTLKRQRLKAMILGLTQPAKIGDQDFDALDYVDQEIERISALLPGSQQFKNEDFTSDRLEQEMNDKTYSIVHIATHAEFGPEPGDTFLVFGNNEKMEINEFDRLIRSVTGPQGGIELLTLTACQTAVGDERAALGIAGIAIQAGAKSAVASLWSIDDEATAQVAERFYQELLKPGLNKAEALRAAQLALIEEGGKFSDPYYWAPLILIGNWL